MSNPKIENMVTKFLCWKLPKEFAPDCGIEFTPPETGSPEHFWPVGTNLFTADQAREMIEHMLSDSDNVVEDMLSPEYGEHDKGPWSVTPDGMIIESADFTHDVQLKVTGDFADSAQRKCYSANIAKLLNQK
ncbi:hypothetical protein [Pseudomaricurvus hydrocarbonicus]|uniref:hypothetical protein n=1 Tax=Pseudomaricurvus hydrocarbonicus TaxID=1470433 RepID=UPI001AA03E38|nr:hypothetical protein [Aestuariicella hydrocarbonica]